MFFLNYNKKGGEINKKNYTLISHYEKSDVIYIYIFS